MSPIAYTLTRKNVKNINLRIRRDGSVAVSAPRHVKKAHIDAFVSRKQRWIEATRDRMEKARAQAWPDPSGVTTAMCTQRFLPILNRTLARMGQHRPVSLRVRTCISRWGSCQKQTRTIMLNRALYFAPLRLVEYVVLHECVHLLVPNHQKRFHDTMQTYMPDYKNRRRELGRIPLGIGGDL